MNIILIISYQLYIKTQQNRLLDLKLLLLRISDFRQYEII